MADSGAADKPRTGPFRKAVWLRVGYRVQSTPTVTVRCTEHELTDRTQSVDFTTEAKRELCRLVFKSPETRVAELAALLRFVDGVRLTGSRVSLSAQVDLDLTARRVQRSLSELYGYRATVHHHPAPGAASGYVVRVDRDVSKLAAHTGLLTPEGELVSGLPAHLLGGNVSRVESLWRGAFLGSGQLISDRRSSGGVQVRCPGIETAVALVGAARRLGVRAKTHDSRTEGISVVVREDEDIAGLLASFGASATLAAWEDRRSRRAQNAASGAARQFGSANRLRSEAAAAATAAEVERALTVLGDDAPAQLVQAGRLRIEHRLVSLEQLAQLADPPTTKDAIAGRIRRLIRLADRRSTSKPA